jgi:hypothetical protein
MELDMNPAIENAPQADTSPFEELLKNFNYAPLEVLRKYAASLGTDDHMELLRALAMQAQMKDEVDNKVEIWEREDLHRNKTRLIIRINNYTHHAFAARTDNLDLSVDERNFIDLRPWDCMTFKIDYTYIRELGSRSKDIYRSFIDFGDDALGLRFDFGLRVNTSFGFFSPTLTPVRTARAMSTGTTPVNCSTRITHAPNAEPYRFTVELTLT